MKLEIKFGIDFEIERVEQTLAKMDWFDSHGYKPKLPQGVGRSSSAQEIKASVLREFDEKKLKEVSDKIFFDFSKIEKQFSKKSKEVFKNNFPEIFFVYLTNYGVGGSYGFPNKVAVNINADVFRIIIHEIIHLFIEESVQKYGIEHWEKERVVDLILNSKEFGFLNCQGWQGGYQGAEKYIDLLFNDLFFKYPEEFFSEIKKVRE